MILRENAVDRKYYDLENLPINDFSWNQLGAESVGCIIAANARSVPDADV
jgi:hypothetical protein